MGPDGDDDDDVDNKAKLIITKWTHPNPRDMGVVTMKGLVLGRTDPQQLESLWNCGVGLFCIYWKIKIDCILIKNK